MDGRQQKRAEPSRQKAPKPPRTWMTPVGLVFVVLAIGGGLLVGQGILPLLPWVMPGALLLAADEIVIAIKASR